MNKDKIARKLFDEMDLIVPVDFDCFRPKPDEDEIAKAFWAAHWASKPSSGELYDGEL